MKFNLNKYVLRSISLATLIVVCGSAPAQAQAQAQGHTLPPAVTNPISAEVSPPPAESPLPRGTAEAPAYPEQWKKFLDNWNEVNRVFKTHIAGARNISIPINPREFKWKIDWEAQQTYCKSIAKAIFEEPQRVELPLPDAIAARDGVEAVHAAIGRSFPKCTIPVPVWSGPEAMRRIAAGLPVPSTRQGVLFKQSLWNPQKWRGRANASMGVGYFIADDYLLEYSWHEYEDIFHGREQDRKPQIRQPLAPRAGWWGPDSHADLVNGCPANEGGPGGPSFEPTAAQGFAEWLPTIFLRIDGYPVPVEFGVYGYNGTEPPPFKQLPLDRWGNRGQKFLFVKSLQHDLWGDWAMSPLPADFAYEDENHTGTGLYKACVINFDTPQARTSSPRQEK